MKAILYGSGAAFVGAIIYGGIALVSGYEFALVAILIGWMVGKAMMKATNGIGGRRFQVAALLLTYASICAGNLPSVVGSMMEKDKQQKATVTKNDGTKAEEAKKTNDASAAQNSLGKNAIYLGIGLVALLAISMAAPFLNIASVSGVIGAVIIFIGLSRAWRETAGVPIEIHGPFRFEPESK